jgi:hypothetical protein
VNNLPPEVVGSKIYNVFVSRNSMNMQGYEETEGKEKGKKKVEKGKIESMRVEEMCREKGKGKGDKYE